MNIVKPHKNMFFRYELHETYETTSNHQEMRYWQLALQVAAGKRWVAFEKCGMFHDYYILL